MKKKYVILMIVLPIIICLCFILMVCLLRKDKPIIEDFNQTYSFPGKRIMYDAHSLKDGRVIYLACDEYTLDDCEIRQDKYPYETTFERSCNFTIARKAPDLKIFIVPFGENRTIILWSDSDEADSVRISIVHLNDCRKTPDYVLRVSRSSSNSERIDYQLSKRKIVTYKDTFDIFYKDSSIFDNKECRLTINADGEKVGGPVEFVYNKDGVIREIYSIAAHSDSKGFVYSKFKSHGIDEEIILRHPNGTQQQIRPLRGFGIISVVEESIGVCEIDEIDSNITCSQYSSNGDLNFEFSSNATNYTSQLTNIYTMPNEGFLMQYLEIEDATGDKEIDLTLTIVKVDAAGDIVGKIKQQKFNGSAPFFDRHIWKNDKFGGYCSIASFIYGEVYKADLFAKCFNDAVFSTRTKKKVFV